MNKDNIKTLNVSQSDGKNFIQEADIQLIRDLPVQEVIEKYISLTKNGAGYKANCPFHQEKTPSFTVTPDKGIFKCFGCQVTGDGISFVMKKKSISFIEAVKEIARDHNITINETPLSDEAAELLKKKEAIFNVNEWAKKWFVGNLFKPENALALKYVKSRWNDESMSLFDIGFAPDGWKNLINAAKDEGYKEESLLEAGLISKGKKENKEKTFDYFRNRVIFPILNKHGMVSGFSGRDFSSKNGLPKYVNTRETIVYNKGSILYGYHLALRSIKEKQNVYLVEGYADVIRLHQIGITNCVAMSGTSLTIVQIEQLKKITPSITLIGDGDPAGQESVDRSARLIIKNGIFCKIISLTAGDVKQDPDSFFKDESHFHEYEKEQNKDYILHLAGKEKDNYQEPDQKDKFISDIASLVGHLPSGSHYDYFDKLGKIIPPKSRWKIKITKIAEEKTTASKIEQEHKKKQTKFEGSGSNETELNFKEILEREAKKFIRVRTDFYKRSFTLTAKKEKAPALFYWKKGTITEDWGRDIIKLISKYDSFVNIPDNSQDYKAEYSIEGNNYFNLFEQSKYFPVQGGVAVTLKFMNHIFQDKVEVALDYLKILYENPVQKLPVICLVSKVQETGKSTFLQWICNIFEGNGIVLGNEDFAGKFNSHYAGKLVIGIDESFIDRTLIKEKIKRLVTDQFINLEAKGRDVIKVDFIGKFILLSNKESNFIQMEDEDNRFFVCKVPQITTKDPDIDKKLTSEIPAFLHYLKERKLVYERKSRLWFDSKEYETDALRKIVMTTRSKVEKEMLQWFESIFDTGEYENEILIIPRKLADHISKNLKSINGLPIEIERILKEEWNLKPEKNQKFYHPFIKEEYDESEKMVVSTIAMERHTGKPYRILRSFIESKNKNSE